MNVRFMSSDSTWADERLLARPAHADGGHSLCVAMCFVFKGKDVLRVTSALAHSVSAARLVVVPPCSVEKAWDELGIGRPVARGARWGTGKGC